MCDCKKRRQCFFQSRGGDTGSGPCYSTPTHTRRGKERTLEETCFCSKKKPPSITCFYYLLPPLLTEEPPCGSMQSFTHLLHNISSVRGETNEPDQTDKRSRPKVCFTAPSKRAVRYYITLFMEVYFSIIANVCASVCTFSTRVLPSNTNWS